MRHYRQSVCSAVSAGGGGSTRLSSAGLDWWLSRTDGDVAKGEDVEVSSSFLNLIPSPVPPPPLPVAPSPPQHDAPQWKRGLRRRMSQDVRWAVAVCGAVAAHAAAAAAAHAAAAAASMSLSASRQDLSASRTASPVPSSLSRSLEVPRGGGPSGAASLPLGRRASDLDCSFGTEEEQATGMLAMLRLRSSAAVNDAACQTAQEEQAAPPSAADAGCQTQAAPPAPALCDASLQAGSGAPQQSEACSQAGGSSVVAGEAEAACQAAVAAEEAGCQTEAEAEAGKAGAAEVECQTDAPPPTSPRPPPPPALKLALLEDDGDSGGDSGGDDHPNDAGGPLSLFAPTNDGSWDTGSGPVPREYPPPLPPSSHAGSPARVRRASVTFEDQRPVTPGARGLRTVAAAAGGGAPAVAALLASMPCAADLEHIEAMEAAQRATIEMSGLAGLMVMMLCHTTPDALTRSADILQVLSHPPPRARRRSSLRRLSHSRSRGLVSPSAGVLSNSAPPHASPPMLPDLVVTGSSLNVAPHATTPKRRVHSGGSREHQHPFPQSPAASSLASEADVDERNGEEGAFLGLHRLRKLMESEKAESERSAEEDDEESRVTVSEYSGRQSFSGLSGLSSSLTERTDRSREVAEESTSREHSERLSHSDSERRAYLSKNAGLHRPTSLYVPGALGLNIFVTSDVESRALTDDASFVSEVSSASYSGVAATIMKKPYGRHKTKPDLPSGMVVEWQLQTAPLRDVDVTELVVETNIASIEGLFETPLPFVVSDVPRFAMYETVSKTVIVDFEVLAGTVVSPHSSPGEG